VERFRRIGGNGALSFSLFYIDFSERRSASRGKKPPAVLGEPLRGCSLLQRNCGSSYDERRRVGGERTTSQLIFFSLSFPPFFTTISPFAPPPPPLAQSPQDYPHDRLRSRRRRHHRHHRRRLQTSPLNLPFSLSLPTARLALFVISPSQTLLLALSRRART
jgi:hypothetical protein